MNRWFALTLTAIIHIAFLAVLVAAIKGETAVCFGVNAAQWLCLLGLKYREAFQ